MLFIFIVIAIAVAAELFLHILYQWKVGGAGIYDKPFDYLKHLDKLKDALKKEWC